MSEGARAGGSEAVEGGGKCMGSSASSDSVSMLAFHPETDGSQGRVLGKGVT